MLDSYQLLVGLTMITIVFTVPIINHSLSEPKRCCFPKQFTAKVFSSTENMAQNGIRYTSYSVYDHAYDEQRGLIGTRGTSKSVGLGTNLETKFHTISAIKGGYSYFFLPELQHCQVVYQSNNVNNCVPETATYVNSSNYDYNGTQILDDTWLVEVNDGFVYQTYSRDQCILLKAKSIENSSTNASSITTEFVDYIVDPSIFDIPAKCQ